MDCREKMVLTSHCCRFFICLKCLMYSSWCERQMPLSRPVRLPLSFSRFLSLLCIFLFLFLFLSLSLSLFLSLSLSFLSAVPSALSFFSFLLFSTKDLFVELAYWCFHLSICVCVIKCSETQHLTLSYVAYVREGERERGRERESERERERALFFDNSQWVVYSVALQMCAWVGWICARERERRTHLCV